MFPLISSSTLYALEQGLDIWQENTHCISGMAFSFPMKRHIDLDNLRIWNFLVWMRARDMPALKVKYLEIVYREHAQASNVDHMVHDIFI